jgi:hypothetical protein
MNNLCRQKLRKESFERVRAEKYLVNYFSGIKQFKEKNVLNMQVLNKLFICYEAATKGKL